MSEFVSQIFGNAYWLLSYILPFLLVLTPVVFFHELGHFAVARWNGVKVDDFAVGFGRELFGMTDKQGTRWKLCAIPLGGYVKFAGDANAASVPDFDQHNNMSEEDKSGSFMHKSVGQRSAIIVAGPIANFILAIVIFTAGFMIWGKPVSDPVIAAVQADSAAEDTGLKAGDIVVSIDGVSIKSFNDIPLIVAPNAGAQMPIVINRSGTLREFLITPREKQFKDRFGNVQRVGIIGITNTRAVGNFRIEKLNFVSALNEAVRQTWYQIKIPLIYIKDIFIGKKSADMLGGPIKIAKYSGDIASQGAASLIQFVAFISVAIGLMNLFPIPMLDGGHLVFYAIEAIRGKPLSEKAQEMGFTMGMLIIFSLMIFTTYNDVFLWLQ
ncbi:MAG: RIP metalloprotease RseP [Hyphomicrobiales bacterium]|nr:RIP metalloprotease RseP [Hyphomicrobiales bacterium]